MMRKKKKP